MEGIVRAITVANTPTTKMETLMTQIISISEACKENLHRAVVRVLSLNTEYFWNMTPCKLVNRCQPFRLPFCLDLQYLRSTISCTKSEHMNLRILAFLTIQVLKMVAKTSTELSVTI